MPVIINPNERPTWAHLLAVKVTDVGAPEHNHITYGDDPLQFITYDMGNGIIEWHLEDVTPEFGGDWDYDDVILTTEVIGNQVKITILYYGGTWSWSIYWNGKVIDPDLGKTTFGTIYEVILSTGTEVKIYWPLLIGSLLLLLLAGGEEEKKKKKDGNRK